MEMTYVVCMLIKTINKLKNENYENGKEFCETYYGKFEQP